MQKIIQERAQVIFDLYKLQMMGECPINFVEGSREQAQKIRWLLASCGLECNKESFYAACMRIFDLNTNLFNAECQKQGIEEKSIRKLVDEFVREFYENHHKITIDLLKNKVDEFKSLLLDLIHNVGLILNSCAPRWLAQVEQNAEFFKQLQDPYAYINEHLLYYKDEFGNKADRIYALCVNLGEATEAMLSYSEYFKEEFLQINECFEQFFAECKKLKKVDQAWLNYLEKLQAALMNTKASTEAFAQAERAWMQVKDEWQLGHFLEYYEDSFTHSVALEWDLRINIGKALDESTFKEQMSSSMNRIYARANVNNPSALKAMQHNLQNAQMYISMPVLYYASALNGLFSAQVVPNDETVSQQCGKKIFAFVDFVRAKSLNKPKTLLNDYVYEKSIRDFNQSVLENEKLFKKVYEFSTIGHEGGHIFFIDHDTEQLMNASGVFKNIEEFKASAGGIFNYIFECPLRGNVKAQMEQAMLANIACRAIGLLAYKSQKEIEPYYTEALIFLKILKDAKCISFNAEPSLKKPLVLLNLNSFEDFKQNFIEVYTELAGIYLNKIDAKEFLKKFAKLENNEFVSTDEQIAKAQINYQKLYKLYASVKKEDK